MFGKVAIIGPGLIGGSMGMALRRKGLAETVIGIGRRQESLDKALHVQAIDKATLDPKQGVQGADLVVLATPIGTFEAMANLIADSLEPEAVLTDVGSSKVRVIGAISAALRQRPDVAYMPSHPMAGSEQSGPLAANASLFEGSVCVLTPLTNTLPATKALMTQLWGEFGATVVSMSPQAHDRMVARISHLPHLVAAALVELTDEADMQYCGGGLRDTTRIASGSPSLWLDICKANREQIQRAVTDYIHVLQQLVDSLRQNDLGRLRAMLEAAKDKRDRVLGQKDPPGHSGP